MLQRQEDRARDVQEVEPVGCRRLNDTIALAKVLLICFIPECNLPLIIADHLVEICKTMFPDSPIAQEMCMKKTKCTQVTKAIGKCVHLEMVSKLKSRMFSVITDESTNVRAPLNV